MIIRVLLDRMIERSLFITMRVLKTACGNDHIRSGFGE